MDSLMVLTMPESTVHAPSTAVERGGPNGGNGARSDSAATLRDAISTLRSGADVQVCPIAMPGDLDGALHRRGSRTIVIAGGDSGLHSVVSALHRRNELDDAVLAMIPAGPAGASSSFARGAGIPASPELAARVILDGHERRLDMLMDCRGEVVVNGASVSGRPDRRSRALTGLGSVARLGAFEQLASRPLRVQVVADDEVITDLDRPVLGVQVNNCPTAFPQAGLCADPCDGYADVVVSFAPSGLRRVRHALRTGRQLREARRARLGRTGRFGRTGSYAAVGAAGTPDVLGLSDWSDGSDQSDGPDGSHGAYGTYGYGGSDGSGVTEVLPGGSFEADPSADGAGVDQPGTHADVLRLRARTVSVAGQWFSLRSDGEDAGAEQRCTWSVLPERLRVIAPDRVPD